MVFSQNPSEKRRNSMIIFGLIIIVQILFGLFFLFQFINAGIPFEEYEALAAGYILSIIVLCIIFYFRFR